MCFYKILLVLICGVTMACNAVESTAQSKTPSNKAIKVAAPTPQNEQIAVFAGGCFWGVEAVFEHTKGVTDVTSGYSGGTAKTANYEDVSNGTTKHAEAVQIKFDSTKISYTQLLEVFFTVAHNPTELNRQGPDVGAQYRSAIFYTNAEQQQIATDFIAKKTADKVFEKPIVTQIVALEKYYQAEKYHQDYLVKNPNERYIIVHDLPKLENLRKTFPDLYR